MTKQAKSWSSSEVEGLIAAYESHPILWDYRHKDYRNRAKKSSVHKAFSEMFNTSPEEIARKLHNLKGQFSQELTKIRKKRSGSDANENYTSNWRYFESLSFLLQGNGIVKSETDTSADTMSSQIDHDTIEADCLSLAESHYASSSKSLHESFKPEADCLSLAENHYASSSKSLHESFKPETDCLSLAENHYASSSKSLHESFKPVLTSTSKKRREDNMISKFAHIVNQPNDDDQIFADYVASELRKLSREGNKKLRRIIQRAIISIQDEEDGVEYS